MTGRDKFVGFVVLIISTAFLFAALAAYRGSETTDRQLVASEKRYNDLQERYDEREEQDRIEDARMLRRQDELLARLNAVFAYLQDYNIILPARLIDPTFRSDRSGGSGSSEGDDGSSDRKRKKASPPPKAQPPNNPPSSGGSGGDKGGDSSNKPQGDKPKKDKPEKNKPNKGGKKK